MTEGVKNFTNIDEEDFEGMYGGEPIVLRRGQTKAFTERIAKHLAGQLVCKILTRQKKNYLLDPGRDELMDRMLGEVVAPAPAPEPIPAAPAETPSPVEEEEEEFPEIKEKVKEPKKNTRTRRIK